MRRQECGDCDASLDIAPSPSTLDSRGLVNLRLGRLDEALADYNAALDNYAAFLSKDAFQTRLIELCGQIGDLKFDLDRCAAH